MSDQPGFKKIKVPGRNDLRPNMRDCADPSAPLAYAKPVQHVMDLGAPRDALTYWRGVPSPASPTFRAGIPLGVNPSHKPEEESVHIPTGISSTNRNKKDVPRA